MLDEKRIAEIKRRVTNFIKEGIIKKEKESKFVDFFLNNAKNSLDSAKLLFEVSTKNNLKNLTGFPNFNGFLWVINSSYYSMFYMVRTLLENEGIRIKADLSIHAVTFDALVHYFYITGKLQKRLIEDFNEAKEEASEMLGKEKAKELIEDYFYEKNKRGTFTYEMGAIAMQNKAQTSLERAKRFNEEIRKIIEI
ncbi:hypothetical protein J4406_00180 [Candidatus Woesearchaeota archaeon]|nr:hypothetical protein [Candidatus Woesearchaeota archaeon]